LPFILFVGLVEMWRQTNIKNAMMYQGLERRNPALTTPLRKLVSVPDCIKEDFGKKQEKIKERNTSKVSMDDPSQDSFSRSTSVLSSRSRPQMSQEPSIVDAARQRAPLPTPPLKSLHIMFQSRIQSGSVPEVVDAKPQKRDESIKQEAKLHMGAKLLTDRKVLDGDEMEKISRKWLHDLNFDTLLTKEKLSLLDDPIRNGTFLFELVSTLEGRKLGALKPNPCNLGDIKHNLELSLSVLKRKNIPAKYLFSTAQIAKGEQHIVWGLIYHIMKVYPDATANTKQHYSKQDALYPSEQMRELEKSLLFWLRSLGLLPLHKQLPETFDDIEEELRNGTILCDLVSFIVGGTIIGVTRNPKISSVALSNISKALEPLRHRKRMCQRFVRDEEEIHNYNKNVILGLFEDIRRYYDGIPPRTEKTKTPYLGNFSSVGMPQFAFQPPNPQEITAPPKTKQSPNPKSKPSLLKQMMSANFSEELVIPIISTPPTELKPDIPTPTKPTIVEQRPYPEPFFPSSQLRSVFLPQPFEIEHSISQMIPPNDDPSQKKYDIFQGGVPYKCEATDVQVVPQKQDVRENDFLNEETIQEHKHILHWIEKGLGIRLNFDTLFDDMTNGTKLSEIVARCEFGHDIRGVDKQPKKTAQKLNNINKTLTVLRNQKDMSNSPHLWSSRQILNGDADVIWGLLSDIYNCYCKNKTKIN